MSLEKGVRKARAIKVGGNNILVYTCSNRTGSDIANMMKPSHRLALRLKLLSIQEELLSQVRPTIKAT